MITKYNKKIDILLYYIIIITIYINNNTLTKNEYIQSIIARIRNE